LKKKKALLVKLIIHENVVGCQRNLAIAEKGERVFQLLIQ
jgi:hypothetical protein